MERHSRSRLARVLNASLMAPYCALSNILSGQSLHVMALAGEISFSMHCSQVPFSSHVHGRTAHKRKARTHTHTHTGS